MNRFTKLREDRAYLMKKKEILHYVILLLTSHTSGLPMQEYVEAAKQFSGIFPSIEQKGTVLKNLLVNLIRERIGTEG